MSHIIIGHNMRDYERTGCNKKKGKPGWVVYSPDYIDGYHRNESWTRIPLDAPDFAERVRAPLENP